MTEMVSFGRKWYKMVVKKEGYNQSLPKWSKMVNFGIKWSKMVVMKRPKITKLVESDYDKKIMTEMVKGGRLNISCSFLHLVANFSLIIFLLLSFSRVIDIMIV